MREEGSGGEEGGGIGRLGDGEIEGQEEEGGDEEVMEGVDFGEGGLAPPDRGEAKGQGRSEGGPDGL